MTSNETLFDLTDFVKPKATVVNDNYIPPSENLVFTNLENSKNINELLKSWDLTELQTVFNGKYNKLFTVR